MAPCVEGVNPKPFDAQVAAIDHHPSLSEIVTGPRIAHLRPIGQSTGSPNSATPGSAPGQNLVKSGLVR